MYRTYDFSGTAEYVVGLLLLAAIFVAAIA
jgi:hypothetical protein